MLILSKKKRDSVLFFKSLPVVELFVYSACLCSGLSPNWHYFAMITPSGFKSYSCICFNTIQSGVTFGCHWDFCSFISSLMQLVFCFLLSSVDLGLRHSPALVLLMTFSCFYLNSEDEPEILSRTGGFVI